MASKSRPLLSLFPSPSSLFWQEPWLVAMMAGLADVRQLVLLLLHLQSSQQQQRPHPPAPSTQRSLCRYFNRPAGCKRGAACKFRHQICENLPNLASCPAGQPARSSSASSSSSSSKRARQAPRPHQASATRSLSFIPASSLSSLRTTPTAVAAVTAPVAAAATAPAAVPTAATAPPTAVAAPAVAPVAAATTSFPLLPPSPLSAGGLLLPAADSPTTPAPSPLVLPGPSAHLSWADISTTSPSSSRPTSPFSASGSSDGFDRTYFTPLPRRGLGARRPLPTTPPPAFAIKAGRVVRADSPDYASGMAAFCHAHPGWPAENFQKQRSKEGWACHCTPPCFRPVRADTLTCPYCGSLAPGLPQKCVDFQLANWERAKASGRGAFPGQPWPDKPRLFTWGELPTA
eukprot:gnl/Hemi2/12022_TR4112_c0_g2_i1.p1 gnl/Hemi2/12022_TR4112_c0_g2~~gnl/Hemi2/12022_TR4112_c0_g2_i1.p1  ORF type:complete len:403 (+),score=67.17 gnl/Hemi2/12022_TR4112_c0_g2_i1:108-1316(+)